MTNETQTYKENYATPHTGTTWRFDAINEPGTYVCNWSGHLLRVPEDGVSPGRSPLINIVGTEPLMVTKISDNPYITLTKAKMGNPTIIEDLNFVDMANANGFVYKYDATNEKIRMYQGDNDNVADAPLIELAGGSATPAAATLIVESKGY